MDGPPALIIEVLGESTYDVVDLDLERGKGFSDAHAGVREYLALDPTGAFIEEQDRGWRLVDGVYRIWEPDALGRRQSESIASVFGMEGTLASVYTREDKRQLREGEVGRERARLRDLEEELAALRRLV